MKVRHARVFSSKNPGGTYRYAFPPAATAIEKPVVTVLGLLNLLWSESQLDTLDPARASTRNGELLSHQLHV